MLMKALENYFTLKLINILSIFKPGTMYKMFTYLLNPLSRIVFIYFEYLFFLREERDREIQGLFVLLYYILNHNSCRIFEEENDVIVRDSNKEENSKSVVPAAASLENLGKKLKLLKPQNGRHAHLNSLSIYTTKL